MFLAGPLFSVFASQSLARVLQPPLLPCNLLLAVTREAPRECSLPWLFQVLLISRDDAKFQSALLAIKLLIVLRRAIPPKDVLELAVANAIPACTRDR